MQSKQAIFLLAIFLAFTSCKKKEIDPCSEPTATSCDGLTTIDPRNFNITYSPHKLVSLSVNPNNPNELVMVGIPSGYEDMGIYRVNVNTQEIKWLSPSNISLPSIPDWGVNGLILFPFRNNAMLPDGTPHGYIKSCPTNLDFLVHWTQGATKIAASVSENGDNHQFVLIDYEHSAIQQFGPVASGAYGYTFSISEDASKVCSIIYGSDMQWTDLDRRETHLMQTDGYQAGSAEWLADNKTLIWTGTKAAINDCGILLQTSAIFSTDVLTSQTTKISDGCFWNQFQFVAASADNSWIYPIVRVGEQISDSEILFHDELWRMHADGSQIEFILR